MPVNYKIEYQHIVSYIEKHLKMLFEGDITSLKSLFPKSEFFNQDFNFQNLQPTFFKYKKQNIPVFVYESGKSLIKNDKINFDIYSNAFLFLSGIQEHFATQKDNHDRFQFKDSLQYKHNFITLPLVNIYFDFLYEKALVEDIKIKRKNIKKLIFTHDIDQLRSGWYDNLIFELNNFNLSSIINIPKAIITKLFALKDPYHKGFEKMREWDNKVNEESIVFWLANKSANNADYHLHKYSHLIEDSIGLHASYNTSINKEEFAHEKQELENISNKSLDKVRQHFLKYDVKITPYIHQKNNINKDYSLGFAEYYGFRNATSTPFYLFDFKNNKAFFTLEIPTFLMDNTLTHYMEGNIENNLQLAIKELKKIQENYQYHFALLFHNSAFEGKKYHQIAEKFMLRYFS